MTITTDPATALDTLDLSGTTVVVGSAGTGRTHLMGLIATRIDSPAVLIDDLDERTEEVLVARAVAAGIPLAVSVHRLDVATDATVRSSARTVMLTVRPRQPVAPETLALTFGARAAEAATELDRLDPEAFRVVIAQPGRPVSGHAYLAVEASGRVHVGITLVGGQGRPDSELLDGSVRERLAECIAL